MSHAKPEIGPLCGKPRNRATYLRGVPKPGPDECQRHTETELVLWMCRGRTG